MIDWTDPSWEIRRPRVAEEQVLEAQLDALRARLLDVQEYLDLCEQYRALRNTPLDCGCHCSGWCGGWNPCQQACAIHRCL